MCWPCCHPLIWRILPDGTELWSEDWDARIAASESPNHDIYDFGNFDRQIYGIATDGEKVFAAGSRASPDANDPSQSYTVKCLGAEGNFRGQYDTGGSATSVVSWPGIGVLIGHEAAREDPLADTGDMVNFTLLNPADGTVIWQELVGEHVLSPGTNHVVVADPGGLGGGAILDGKAYMPQSQRGAREIIVNNIAIIDSSGSATLRNAGQPSISNFIRSIKADGAYYYFTKSTTIDIYRADTSHSETRLRQDTIWLFPSGSATLGPYRAWRDGIGSELGFGFLNDSKYAMPGTFSDGLLRFYSGPTPYTKNWAFAGPGGLISGNVAEVYSDEGAILGGRGG